MLWRLKWLSCSPRTVQKTVFTKGMGCFQMEYKHLVCKINKHRQLLNTLWWDSIIKVKNSVKCIHGDHIPKNSVFLRSCNWEMQSARCDELVHYCNPAFFWFDWHDSNGKALKAKCQCDKQIARRMKTITTRAWAVPLTKGEKTEHLSHVAAAVSLQFVRHIKINRSWNGKVNFKE